MTQAGISERRLGSVGELTQERLAELRRVAEAATPGPLTMHLCDDARYAAFVDAPHLGPDAPELAVFLIERDARFFAEFDRDIVLAMLYEIERLQRIESAARRVRATHPYDHSRVAGLCDCSLCELNAALDGEKGGDRRE